MMNPDYPEKSNKQLIGFCIDLFEQLQREITFQYKMHLVKDGMYGIKDPVTGAWNGMIQEVIDDVCTMTLSVSLSLCLSVSVIHCKQYGLIKVYQS